MTDRDEDASSKTMSGCAIDNEQKDIGLSNLNLKERKLIKGMLQGMSPRQAALAAGFGNSSYLKALNNNRVKESMETLMDAAGLGTRELLELHHGLVYATKSAGVITDNNDGEMTTETVEVPDWNSRARGLEIAYKLRGLFKSQDSDLDVETHEQRLERLRQPYMK